MAAVAGAFPPGGRGQNVPESRGGSWQDPQGGPVGGPGVGPEILVGPDNLIKRASPESRSSDDFWLGVMRDGSN